jgi:hypothetical protein
LQLKLHIPGNPKKFGKKIFDQNSPTFHKGKIGAFKDCFSAEAYEKFYHLPQDFVQRLGFDFDYPTADNIIPNRAREFRTRSLTYSEADFESTQILVERQYSGYSIFRFDSRYFAVPEYLRLPLGKQRDLTLKLLLSDKNLLELKTKINQRGKIFRIAGKLFWYLYFGGEILLKRRLKK